MPTATERLPYLRGNEPGEPLRALVIDDEPLHAEAVAESLRRIGYDCTIATSGTAGARRIEQEEFDVVLTDLLLGDMNGLALVRKVKHDLQEAEVVVVTGHGDEGTAVEAIKQGATYYLTKPVDMAELRAIVEKAAQRVRLSRELRELKRLRDEKFGFEGIIGNSPKMHKVINDLKAVAPTSVTVLIKGETGTGKELVARALHNNSPRKDKKFTALNCTAFNENLLDDELFGHEKGAFTGAERRHIGKFEYANGGTLFLDEVGDIPLPLQAKLLRVLENQEVFRIGSNEPVRVNVRLVSATNRDLEEAVAKGTFRQDLYHRLKVITIQLPPLRERREDIPLLAHHFIEEFNARHDKHVARIAEPVRKAMDVYEWPGNVRELRNLIESMVVLDTDGVLSMDDLQEGDGLHRLSVPTDHAAGPDSLVGRPLTEVERYYIERALERTKGNREEAARMLGIGERTLYRVMQDWKQQDRVRQALAEAGGNPEQAARALNLSAASLQRKLKKWGLASGSGKGNHDGQA
jgi:two-component system response regulator HydG